MSLSIRWRLAIGIVLAFLVTMAAAFATVQFSLQRTLVGGLDDDLERDSHRIVAEVGLVGSVEDTERLQEVIRRSSTSSEAESPFIAVIRNTEGQVLRDAEGQPLSTPNVAVDLLDLSPQELERVLQGQALSRNVDLLNSREFRVRTERLAIAGKVVGVVQVAEDAEAVAAPVNRLRAILIIEGVAVTLAALGIAYWLSGGAVRPLQRVIDVAATTEASGLHRRIGARGQPAEVQRLADTFDAMLARLDSAFEERRNFVLDISHDLRTPLTVLRGNIDVMLMDEGLDRETRGQLERMSAEVGRLVRLTTNLLYMAAADVGREPERRPVELDVLCLEVYRQARDLRRDVKLTLGKEDQVTVMGDSDLLRQMILNLVDNGLKYTPAGGKVNLSVLQNGGFALIVVEDSGPGIPPENLPHIFERFYRGSERGKKGGTGIGLAIANWIAGAHGGRIEVESDKDRGSKFTVLLPLDGQTSAAGEDRPSAGPPSEE